MPSGSRARRGGRSRDYNGPSQKQISGHKLERTWDVFHRCAGVWKLSTHPLRCLGPEPVFPRSCIPGVARQLGGVAILYVAQQSTRLVGFEGREVGPDEDGLLLEGRTQPGIVCRARACA